MKMKALIPALSVSALAIVVAPLSSCNTGIVLPKFEKASLETIISAINTFESSTQDETAMRALCATFKDTEYISEISGEITDKNRQIEAHLTNFIGKTTTIKINGKNHTVRVIGINHDLLAGQTNKYAAFTFDMVTLLSDNNGDAVTCEWDSSNNYDYTNSILRWNLNGAGSGTKPSGVWTTSAFQKLPSELQTNIKSVNKKVATTSSYTVLDSGYNDKLFPLTYTEMAQSSSCAKKEGSAYKYWTDHNTNGEELKTILITILIFIDLVHLKLNITNMCFVCAVTATPPTAATWIRIFVLASASAFNFGSSQNVRFNQTFSILTSAMLALILSLFFFKLGQTNLNLSFRSKQFLQVNATIVNTTAVFYN